MVATLEMRKLSVCLLDDDPSVLKSTRRLLHSVGWEVESFTDPRAFLEHAATARPQVAVLDVWMPEMNGLDVQRRLREISPATRVIVLTSKDDASVRATAMNAGASAFFLKGIQNDEFLAGIAAAAASQN